jgi:hypothetical protein
MATKKKLKSELTELHDVVESMRRAMHPSISESFIKEVLRLEDKYFEDEKAALEALRKLAAEEIAASSPEGGGA